MLETHPWTESVIAIGPGNLHCFLDHLLRLDAEERLQRFCRLADDPYLRDYVARLDFIKGKIIGCFDGDNMHGAAELRPAGVVRSRVFEATFSVEMDWHGQGIERALLLRAISVARAMGARQILIDRLGSSEHMRHIVAQFDTELLFSDDDCQAWLPLAQTYRYGSP